MQVGQTIYGYHGNNNRPYGRDGLRMYMELPIGWEPCIITSETKQSWTCGNIKVNKKTMEQRISEDYTPIKFVATLEEVERACFVAHNGLADKIRRCRDYDKLKRIEAILMEEE